jgi:hypothetical protein
MCPCPQALWAGGDRIDLFFVMSVESLIANTFSIGTALLSLEHGQTY